MAIELNQPKRHGFAASVGQASLAKVHNSFTITLEHNISVLRMRHNEETQSDLLYF